jgi:hypothetical protein
MMFARLQSPDCEADWGERFRGEQHKGTYRRRHFIGCGRLRARLRLLIVMLMPVARRQAGIVLRLAGERHAVRRALDIEQREGNGQERRKFEREARSNIIATTSHAAANR